MEYLEAHAWDGSRVLEAELRGEPVEDCIARAQAHGAELLWVHSNANLSEYGFERFPGYVRMRAENPPPATPLPPLARADYARTLDEAYWGRWGHKLVAPDASPPPEATVFGLYDGTEPIGLCTVFMTERLVDGPGVVPDAREPAAYTRLLRGACAELGPGPVDLDSWGDPPDVIEAYAQLGFSIVEQSAGWQFRLTRANRGPDHFAAS
jgi:hypothetical protein